MGARHPLQLQLAALGEFEAVLALGLLAQRFGDEDLGPRACAAIRAASTTLRPKKSPSSAIALPVCSPIRTLMTSSSRLAGVLGQGALDVDRTAQRRRRLREDEHEAVALVLDLVAVVGPQARRKIALCWRSSSSQRSSPRRSLSTVESSMSLKRIVTVPSGAAWERMSGRSDSTAAMTSSIEVVASTPARPCASA